ncbi:integral membrane protein S linking to the trans Golgi network-domain-containing protein [Apiosordaria backusii]|uniref:Integral membrane protein S linking to the trans Golgi network-domain-containing protein n=1 Tax=Apiosordaria backusii TaxID=314023 RepID=A0AA40AT87_9PEZI|nr:integral membrane protein S linking to the trans Golgi network-domain-containing protein [Apiosordaria backusii]
MARRRRPPRPGAISELPPLKIASQILALQSLYYLFSFILLLFSALAAGTPFSLDLVLGWQSIRGDTTQGWLCGFLAVLNGGVLMGAAIVVLIGRSKLVTDFALSLHGIHLLVAWFYTGEIPKNMAWWVSMITASIAGVMLGTWGCRYRELKPISFGGNGGNNNNNNQHQRQQSQPGELRNSNEIQRNDGEEEDLEQGYSRGRGRGRGRDGGGEYEMVDLPGGEGSNSR